MLMEKDNWRVQDLKLSAGRSEFALIGTSHGGRHSMPAGVHYVKLTGGHNLPPAMYYEIKALLKYPRLIKTAYIEADDHLFLNGGAYDIKIPAEKNTQKSAMYNSYGSYFNEEGRSLFGVAGEENQSHKMLFLQSDIKPIILKRVINRIFNKIDPVKDSGTGTPNDVCEKKPAIVEPNVTNETYWSRLQGVERERKLAGRLSGFALDTPSKLSPLMTEYYEKTIQLLIDSGVQVVLVRFPVSEDFQKGVHPENTATISNYIDGLRTKNKLRMLDISYLSKYGDRFFEDEDHAHTDFSPLIGALIIDDYCKNRQANNNL